MSVSNPVNTAPTLRPPPVYSAEGMVISVNFSLPGFGKRWSHCHQLANFLARYASANDDDPERHATLLSTFFNELLEAIYRNHDPEGKILIRFRRSTSHILVEAEIPVNEQSDAFYRHAVQLVNQPDPMAWYREQLENDVSDDNDAQTLGLLELAVVYGSRITINEATGGGCVTLAIDFPFTEIAEFEVAEL